MTTFVIIALTVLGTIVIEILILVLIALYEDSEDAAAIKKLKCDLDNITFTRHPHHKLPKELTKEVDAFFEILNNKDTEPIKSYLGNLTEYKNIIDKTPNKFLDFHFQNSIRDDQYELSQYISDVAKERGIILKAELDES